MMRFNLLILLIQLTLFTTVHSEGGVRVLFLSSVSGKEALLEEVKSESKTLLPSQKIEFFLKSGSHLEEVRMYFQSALLDDEIDIILLNGNLAFQCALEKDLELTKPVVGVFLNNSDVIELPVEGNACTKSNLSLVISSSLTEKDFQYCTDLFHPSRVHVLIDHELQGLTWKRSSIQNIALQYGFELEIIWIGEEGREVITQLESEELELVCMFSTMEIPMDETNKILDYLERRKVPSYCMEAESTLSKGLLKAYKPNIRTQVARRIVFNLQDILSGLRTDELPIYLPVEKKFHYNPEVAKAIGFIPTFEVIKKGQVLSSSELIEGELLDLSRALEYAVSKNLDILVQDDDERIRSHELRSVKGSLLPQVSTNYSYMQGHANGNIPITDIGNSWNLRSSQSAGVSASQVIFSDKLLSQLKSLKKMQNSDSYFKEVIELDTIEKVTIAYLHCLSTNKRVNLAKENLRITQSHLEMFRLRREVGNGDVRDVLRLEIQEASDKATASKMNAEYQQAFLQLNALMNVDLNKKWVLKDIDLQSPLFKNSIHKVNAVILDREDVSLLHKHLKKQAIGNAPEIKMLEEQELAERIQLGYHKRSFVVPEVFLKAQYSHLENRYRQNGLNRRSGDPLWQMDLRISLPLFSGGTRLAEVRKKRAQMDKLEHQRLQVQMQILAKLSYSFESIRYSKENIDYTRVSKEKSERNLGILSRLYKKGAVNLIELLDAQQQAYNQSLNSTIANYMYLQDLTHLMRAIGRFEFLHGEEENTRWYNNLLEEMGKIG